MNPNQDQNQYPWQQTPAGQPAQPTAQPSQPFAYPNTPAAVPQPAVVQPNAYPQQPVASAQSQAPSQGSSWQADLRPAGSQRPMQAGPYQHQAAPTPPSSFAAAYAANPGAFPASRRRSRFLLIALVALAVLLIGGGASAYVLLSTPPTPDKAFRLALENALSTTSVTQTEIADGGELSLDGKMVFKFDTADTHNLRISSTASLSASGKPLEDFVGYGSLSNTYGKITKSPDPTAVGVNKWIQVRKDGKTLQGADDFALGYAAYDPRYAMLGEYIFANLGKTDRDALVNYIVQNQVYKYDSTKVTKGTVNGVAVYKYPVTVQHLDTMNQKAAKALGIADSDAIKAAAESFPSGTKVTMYVTVRSPELVKVTAMLDGAAGTELYTDYNATKLAAEPKADMQYGAYLDAGGSDNSALLASLLGVDPSSLIGSSTASDRASANAGEADDQRKSNLQEISDGLESYNFDNGNYPTLAEMNDSGWFAQYMSNYLDQSTLQDPRGSSPTLAGKPIANQYAYQVGTDSSLKSCEVDETQCEYYILTATLSDGTTFVLHDAFDTPADSTDG